ncbi:MAG TPA: hypothetical protein V6D29_13425 [Leptolyngbyaceae cyanobacterium]
MVLTNRSRRPIRPQRPPARAFNWAAGLEVGLFFLISGGAGAALLWFATQGEASLYSYPSSTPSGPALSSPAPATSVAQPCVNGSGGVAQAAITCIQLD